MMSKVEQYRRRLISTGNADSGYVIYGWDNANFTSDGWFMIFGYEFNMSQVASISLDGVSKPINRRVNIPAGNVQNIVANLKGLTSCGYMLSSAGSGVSMKYIDVSNLDTSKVITMERMFAGAMENIRGLSSLNTGNVKNLRQAFLWQLRSFEAGEISGWDTSNVEDMSYVFAHEGYVTTEQFSIDISGWDTSKAQTMEGMFSNHGRLTELKMMGKTNPNANVTNMFKGVYLPGVFYYNSAYDYSHIIAELPSNWTTQAL